MTRYITLVAMIATLSLTSAATANPPLRDVKEIDDGLFAVALADQIRKTCPEISARIFPAYRALRDLQNTARSMGYSQAEIDAHIESDAEKDRLRARGAQYFRQEGLAADVAGHCALGRKEIARNSTVGVLLKVSQ